jgi:hypothetical protein
LGRGWRRDETGDRHGKNASLFQEALSDSKERKK